MRVCHTIALVAFIALQGAGAGAAVGPDGLVGVWTAAAPSGDEVSLDFLSDGRCRWSVDGQLLFGRYSLNTSSVPHTLDIDHFTDPRVSNRVFRAILHFQDEERFQMLGKMCKARSGKGRPEEFGEEALVFRREHDRQPSADLRVTPEMLIGVWRIDHQHSSDVLALGQNQTALYMTEVGRFPVRWNLPESNILEVASIAFTNCPSRILCRGIVISPKRLKMHGHPISSAWTKTEDEDKVTARGRIPMSTRQIDAYRRLIESRILEDNANKAIDSDEK